MEEEASHCQHADCLLSVYIYIYTYIYIYVCMYVCMYIHLLIIEMEYSNGIKYSFELQNHKTFVAQH